MMNTTRFTSNILASNSDEYLDPFEQVPIGETGVTVSQLGFGSVFVGGREHGDGTPASEYETALARFKRPTNSAFDTSTRPRFMGVVEAKCESVGRSHAKAVKASRYRARWGECWNRTHRHPAFGLKTASRRWKPVSI